MKTELALYEHAREALAEAVSFDEVTQIRDRAEQAKAYARIARDRKLMADAQELIARAERKLGIMLRQVKQDGLLSQGGRPSENSNILGGSGPGQPHAEPETGADAEPVFDATPFTLAELGISKKLSSRAQQLAEVDEDVFESSVAATREKILSTDAAVVSGPKIIRTPAPAKPAPTMPLAAQAFHRFAFSVLALSLASDRVSSEALLDMAQHCGIVARDGADVEFTPEAFAALGTLAEVALKALDRQQHNTPEGSGTARKASGGQPLPEQSGHGEQGDIGGLQHGTQSAPQPLSTEEADAVIRAGYAAEPPEPVSALALAIGRPGNKAYVRNRARVMGLSSRDNQRAAASAFATAQHAARREGTA